MVLWYLKDQKVPTTLLAQRYDYYNFYLLIYDTYLLVFTEQNAH